MATSGRVVEASFTPPAAGVVKVRCTSTMSTSGSGGGYGYGLPFCEQSSTTTYGTAEMRPPRFTEQTLVSEFVFDVTGGSLVKVGLWGGLAGLASVNFTNTKVQAWFTPT